MTNQFKPTGLIGPSMPPTNRGSMVAKPWQGLGNRLPDQRIEPTNYPIDKELLPWQRAAINRRRWLLAFVALSTMLATYVLSSTKSDSTPWLHYLQTGLFVILFAWVAAGTATALMGFWAVIRGDKHVISKASALKGELSPEARTAVIMPICNEDVSSVFACLKATWESLQSTTDAKHFDLFILSDSSNPDLRSAELSAWADLRQLLNTDRIFYRWRQHRTKRKAGNVADFCRRWGKDYRYMIVLDADSVMSGEALSTLTRLMEAHPEAGILQTSPQSCGLNTLHARSQQFATKVTGRLFTAGMQFWQLGEAHYWGHNAIIRVKPFMEHCGLASLPGKGGLSGHIMSHDFVEAALMRRAGFHVWLVPDLMGSYEQQPPHLLAELQRDRRWCQGNLQNLRLITEPGLHGVHRAMLLTGALAYASAPLWMVYIALGLLAHFVSPTYSQALTNGVIALWVGTAAMLFLPRVLGVLAVIIKGEQRHFGGSLNLIKSALLETVISAFLAPLRMVVHALFVVVALTGLKLEWVSPPREASAVKASEAARHFGSSAAVVSCLAIALFTVQPMALLWLAPIGLPLIIAIPMTVISSKESVGLWLRQHGFLVIPEESWSPAVLRRAWEQAQVKRADIAWDDVLRDPKLSALVISAMGSRHTSQGVRGRVRRQWVEQVSQMPELTPASCMRFLSEPNSLQQLRAAKLFSAPVPVPPSTANSRAYG